MNRTYLVGAACIVSIAAGGFLIRQWISPADESDVGTLTSAVPDRVALSNRERGPHVEAEHARAQADLREGHRTQVSPALTCIQQLPDGLFRLHWGYSSDNDDAVRRKLGDDNHFGAAPEDRGQPSLFMPGTQNDVFTTTAKLAPGASLTWFLDGKSAVASSDSRRCTRADVAAADSGRAGGDAAGTTRDEYADVNGSRGGAGSARHAYGPGATNVGPSAPGTPGASTTPGARGTPGMPTAGTGAKTANSSCAQCEAVGNGMTQNCPMAARHCDNLPSGKSQLCHEILDCIHGSHCAKNFNASDCLCGANVPSSECFAGSFAAMTGPCRDLMAAGSETNVPAELSLRFSDVSYPVGGAIAMLENCDYTECGVCL